VEAVAPHAFLGQLLGNGVKLRQLGLRAMERGVEARDLRHVGRGLGDCPDRREVVRLVQRGERRERGEVFDHPCFDAHRRGVVRPAVHHPVADAGDLLAVEQLEAGLQDHVRPGAVIELACRPLALDQFLAGCVRNLHPGRGADLLDLPLEQQFVAGAVGVEART
jgi:hypothetical protein